MVCGTWFGNWITVPAPLPVSKLFRSRRNSNNISWNKRHGGGLPFSKQILCSQNHNLGPNKAYGGVHYDSLRVLEWDKLCDLVSSFAATSLGREATKVQLWSLNSNYEESLRLLKETNAAVEMHKHGACSLDFTGIDLLLVKSAIRHARRSLLVGANEAMAVAAMLEFTDILKLNLEAAIKEDDDWYNRFMPLSQMIMELVINRTLVRMIHQVLDEDGSIKDSASSALKRSRDQVRLLEKKLYQLMDTLIRNNAEESSFLEVSNLDGRWCIKSQTNQLMSLKGLLLSSDSGTGCSLEPLSAIPLNDELQRARESVAKAEADVLLILTEKMRKDLDEIERISNSVIQLDVINARATYSLSFRGACPDLYLPEDKEGSFTAEASENEPSEASYPLEREWILYMPKAYHPLLLHQHKKNLQKAQKDANTTAVSASEQAHPVPVDCFIAKKTKVLVITGPNTGGKTIYLKTIGLAAMMAKSGLHVLSSESVQLPWFDYILADIGDEQSLSQSLSTFSGHLKQISDIHSQLTNQSLVLLDEVGAGTNPLEGAALGMSLLESFAASGALLTIATTHHGELKSLKYSNDAFENASMEFDEVNLKPTYKILWGVPGRSNAISIAEKLGLPGIVIGNARKLFGDASAEINEVIIDMERFKQDFLDLLYEAEHHLMLARNLHEKLLMAKRKIMQHGCGLRYRKKQEILEAAALARSIIHKKVQKHRAYITKTSQPPTANRRQILASNQYTREEMSRPTAASERSYSVETKAQLSSVRRADLPQIGDTVQVPSLGRKAKVLRVDQYKEEIVVQSGNMKLKLKLMDIET